MPNFLHSKTMQEPESSNCQTPIPSSFVKMETVPAKVLEEKIIASQKIQVEEIVIKDEQVAGNMQSSSGDASPRSIAKSGTLEFTAAANLLSANPNLKKEFKEVL